MEAEAEAGAGAGSMIFVDVLSERESRSELAEIRRFTFGDWEGSSQAEQGLPEDGSECSNNCATHSCLAAVAEGGVQLMVRADGHGGNGAGMIRQRRQLHPPTLVPRH